jgi:hypothetical protein
MKRYDPDLNFRPPRDPATKRIFTYLRLLHCIQGIYATILNYSETELRYMDAGE